MGAIVEIQLKRLEKLLADRKIALELDEDARDWLADEGLRPGLWRAAAEAGDPEGTAGSAGRADPAGEIRDGSTVKITAGSDRLNFKARATAAEQADQAA